MKQLIIAAIFMLSLNSVCTAQRTAKFDSSITSKYQYQKTIDSLKTALNISKFKIQKVKYYLAIVDKRPSQIKYLKGWVRRAVK